MPAADLGNTEGRLTFEQRPFPLGSLLAAATRLKSQRVLTRSWLNPSKSGWQSDAWDMYDLVGEERFLVNTIANRLSQARFFCGLLPDDPTEEIEVVEQGPAYDIFDSFRRSGIGQTQNVSRVGLNLAIPGECYLVGYPPPDPDEGLFTGNLLEEGIDLTTLIWRVCSTDEISIDIDQVITLDLGPDEQLRFPADSAFVIRIWRPHPRKWWEPDSPAKASLPVLRELVGLTMHISAQIDSRLAGAGVFIVPSSAKRAVLAAANLPEDSLEDPFTQALMDAMLTPIQDRANASAIVPLVLTVPDDAADKFRHISFATQLDSEARNLREESIRRLALGQDCPPELLLGVGSMNHWGAWLVREDVVTTHLEPPLALVCDALTTQYLWPCLEAQGHDRAEIQRYVIWYDVDHMILRPNRAQDAKDLYAAGVINDETLRDASGFDESNAPATTPPAVDLAIQLITRDPALMTDPGLASLVSQIEQVLGPRVGPTGVAPTQIAGTPAAPPPAAPDSGTNPSSSGESDGGVPVNSTDANSPAGP